MSQTERVYNYMKEFGSITSLDAFKDLGATRLSANIYTIDHNWGIPVYRKTETSKNRWGENTHYTRYSLTKWNDENEQ